MFRSIILVMTDLRSLSNSVFRGHSSTAPFTPRVYHSAYAFLDGSVDVLDIDEDDDPKTAARHRAACEARPLTPPRSWSSRDRQNQRVSRIPIRTRPPVQFDSVK